MINPAIELLVRDAKASLQSLYGDRLLDVILYGSYARGDYDDESDIDLLLVLNDETVDTITEVFRLSELTMNFIHQHGKALSVLPVAAKRFDSSFMPVYQNGRREGVVISTDTNVYYANDIERAGDMDAFLKVVGADEPKQLLVIDISAEDWEQLIQKPN